VSVYATPEELAAALRIAVTVKNSELLDACIAAASAEIDHETDRYPGDATAEPPIPGTPIDPADPLAHMVCIARGVEWYKANDSVFGVIGFADTGVLAAPRDTFGRHAATLIPLRQQFGIA
jgi:hypothetical protein